MNRVSVCNLCLNAGAAWYCRKDSVDVLRCLHCGLIYAAEIREREDLVEHYGDHYFEPYLKTEAIHLKKRFGKRIEEIKKYARSGTLLDVGCGIGVFVKLANDSGYNAEGLELSPFAAQYASRQLGLRVFQGELADAGFADQSFDIITLWHIMEHVRDPRTLLGQVNKLLKSNGLLALEIPNIGSPVARVAGVHWELMAPMEHFYYFNKPTIKRYMEECGFSVIRMQTSYWTTPAMILRAHAGNGKPLSNHLLRSFAKIVSCFSLMRFRTAPSMLEGDVLTVYAAKKGAN